MKIFRDRHGKTWIHGSGVRKYFRLNVPIYKFYDYDKLLKLRFELATQDNLIVIRNFMTSVKHNQEYENKIELDFEKAKKAVKNFEKLIKQSAEVVNATIPPLKILDKDFVYSVRTPEKPPFIARTNAPEVIEKIYKFFMRIGGWENVKFLFENLRLNDERNDLNE